jgi:response regulator RpfG family c-di-GMP phosphodiesterase
MGFQTDTRPVWLYIDDNESEVVLLRNVFEEHCAYARLTSFQDGRAAIDFLNGDSRQPDIIMLDVRTMPWTDIDGIKQIRAIDRHIRTPVIVFSALEDPAMVNAAYGAGANAYVFKPSNLEEFIRVMKGVTNFWCNAVLLPRPQHPRA